MVCTVVPVPVPTYPGDLGFPKVVLKLRKNFPESWIWETVGESRFVTFSSLNLTTDSIGAGLLNIASIRLKYCD